MSTPFIDVAGTLGAGIGQGLLGFQEARQGQREDFGKRAMAAWAAGDVEGAYHYARKADEVRGLFGPLSDRQGPKLIGTPTTQQVAAPGVGSMPKPADLSGAIGLPATPGAGRFGINPVVDAKGILSQKLGAPGPETVTVKGYDASRPDFNNSANVAAIGKYVGAPPPKLEEATQGSAIYYRDPATGKPVIVGQVPYAENPYKVTAEDTIARWMKDRELRDLLNRRNNETRLTVNVNSEDGKNRRFTAGEEGKDRRQMTAADIAAERRAKALEDKEIAERARAAAIAGRYVTSKFGGVAKVNQATADIEFDGLYPMTDKQRRMLENAATDVGGFFYEEPGKKPRIIMNPGSTAASLRDKLKAPGLVTDKTTGRRVRDGEGVQVAAPAGAMTWAQMSAQADRQARGLVRAKYAGQMVPPDPAMIEAEVMEEKLRILDELQQHQPGAVAPVDPAAALMEEMRAEREAKKGGKK